VFGLFNAKKTMRFLVGPDREEVSVRFPDRAPTVLEVALENGVDLPTSCGGMGTCGACRVIIESSPTPPPPRNRMEKEMALERGFTSKERLGCQLFAREGLCVRIPDAQE
jgi:Na+-transporting NADH:ubiquinone oxidoreductase subunit F